MTVHISDCTPLSVCKCQPEIMSNARFGAIGHAGARNATESERVARLPCGRGQACESTAYKKNLKLGFLASLGLTRHGKLFKALSGCIHTHSI